MNRLERMPVPVLPTFVGALTLSNVFSGMGYAWVRHITMWAATIVLLLYIVKIVKFPKACLKEYETVVPSSLYAAFCMILMILGSYYFDYVPALGKGIWAVAICIHAAHILLFTYRNIIRKRDVNTFVPSWFVTYNGIMVSCVVGGAMNAAGVLKYIVYYGIIIYFVLVPVMIWRLLKFEVKAPVYHTMAVLLAPCSLCVVSYLEQITGDRVNGKGEVRPVDGPGIALHALLAQEKIEGYTKVTVISGDSYSAELTAEEVAEDGKACLLLEEDALRLIVFGDKNSKRSVSDVAQIVIE